jgi:hypothetical protein
MMIGGSIDRGCEISFWGFGVIFAIREARGPVEEVDIDGYNTQDVQ